MFFGIDFGDLRDHFLQWPAAARLGLLFVVLCAFGGGYYSLYYGEARAEVTRLQGRSLALQREIANVRVIAGNLAEFQREVEALEREFVEALAQLPNRKQFEDLLQDITTVSKKVGVQIRSIERAPEVSRDFYAEVPFRLELEGSYHGLAMFFERLARLPRIVNMGTLKIRSLDDSGAGTTLRVEGQATTYRFLESAPEGEKG
jgi:type IV pilus assembly protein PilO